MELEQSAEPLVSSRQRRWQIKKTLEGGCQMCGKKRKSSKNYCDRHALETRLRNRHLTGSKPWQRGGRGRPPKEINVTLD